MSHIDNTSERAASTVAHAPPVIRARIRIGSRVMSEGGEDLLGTVEKVVISPKTRQVTHLLVHRTPVQLLHHDVLVPVAAVGAVNEDAVRLSVPAEVFNRMTAHDEPDYAAPAAGWVAPEGYQRDEVLFALPGGTGATEKLLPRTRGHTGITEADPEGVPVGSGTKVESGDGSIGSIDRVLLDPDTGRVTHFVVRKGQFVPKHVVVPVDWAEEITPERIRLAVDREQLASLPEYRPDDEVAEAVLDELKSYPPIRRLLRGVAQYDPAFSVYEDHTVRIMVQDGVVTLEGNVQTSGQASMAAWLAQQVPGVRQVRNLLVADEDIQTFVANALAKDPRTRSVHARVGSRLGVVALVGDAPDEAASVAAAQVASEVPGVRGVVNNLRVKDG